LLCDIPGFQTVDVIADRLNLPLRTVNETLQFLLSIGMCAEENGLYKMGFKRTFLESNSQLIARYHTNWRLKAVDHFDKFDYIEEILKFHIDSPSEELQVLNIDWFKL
jgi:hypothetical protein